MKPLPYPQIPANLTPLNKLSLITHDATLLSIVISGSNLPKVKAKGLVINESALDKVILLEAELEKLGLRDVIFSHGDLTAANCAESSWQRVQVKQTRCSGLKVQSGTFKDVLFESCKLNLANFRFSKIKNVQFIDCNLDESDFYQAELENVQFQNCTLRKTEFSGAKLKHVDLRSSDLIDVLGVSGLAGATIGAAQLISLAPLLANEAHINVKWEQ
ncbi:MAG TPA: pentapeptide repeat-containing protein [Candidatus Saccharimonadales bacterium]|jgi:uncharacterized protein YjbI with pentapeptide repeats|nr:pentapeptide repeat-containing protein [Candidatus Saccharimonadales bacterium]